MKIGAPTETAEGEARVALTPESAERLQKLGYECLVESGAGAAASITDAAYEAAGVKVLGSASELWSEADVIVKVREPSLAEVDAAPEGKTLISFIWPAANEDLLAKLQAKQMSVLAMDMVPRISRAQKMDALSSMANIAGYRAVVEAGNNFGRFFMGQMTAAGKVP
ncbi:MAG: NAD(P)(+) transhydrogenase (Re/Si-specific) subunit alpha, partial [Pseudomonadales bacterium]|nr:NAD(P)(+) transhydrogenase (Re/Si-specific) subunit alpha [Pseudomonadales bacterium]